MSEEKEPPVLEIRAGRIFGEVWSKETNHNGRTLTEFTVRIEKRYKDERTGKWRKTSFLHPYDLPDLDLVTAKAREFTRLHSRAYPAGGDADS